MDVTLVDKHDTPIGSMEKLEAHKQGRLHRAFSVLIFNSKDELLLQKRSSEKYHSPGLWTNTCCSHPQPGKDIIKSAKARLMDEIGIDCDIKEKFSFTYRAEFDNELIEHEFDRVFIGHYDGDPKPNPKEVSDWRWISMDELKKDIKDNPDKYTEWLKIIVDKF